jgi:hypothetical protein
MNLHVCCFSPPSISFIQKGGNYVFIPSSSPFLGGGGQCDCCAPLTFSTPWGPRMPPNGWGAGAGEGGGALEGWHDHGILNTRKHPDKVARSISE